MSRQVLFVVHSARSEAVDVAADAAAGLIAQGLSVALTPADADAGKLSHLPIVESAHGCELVIVFGGDGTILRGVEVARASDVPVLGVNMGHVGFLAEAEPEDLAALLDVVINQKWSVEERFALTVSTSGAEEQEWTTWALNDVAIEKFTREHLAELMVSIDHRPLSRWACDGLLVSTPTGSTAYAFSAGGPVVWPEVDAMLVVPVSAHALFARPLVVAPNSVVQVDVLNGPVVISADGRRSHDLSAGASITVTRSAQAVKLARIHQTPFTERLVAKFALPVHGWRAQ